MSITRITTHQYDQIAEIYLEKNRDRSRIMAYLDRFVSRLIPKGLVLDIGCGPGFDAALLREREFRVIGVEFSRGMLALGKRHFPGAFVRADMKHLPFRAVADGLWVNASMLHIERKAVPHTLQEFYRALKPNGILFVSVKEGSGERWEHGPYTETVRRWFTYWETDSFKVAIADAGFREIDLRSNGIWLTCCAQKPEQ